MRRRVPIPAWTQAVIGLVAMMLACSAAPAADTGRAMRGPWTITDIAKGLAEAGSKPQPAALVNAYLDYLDARTRARREVRAELAALGETPELRYDGEQQERRAIQLARKIRAASDAAEEQFMAALLALDGAPDAAERLHAFFQARRVVCASMDVQNAYMGGASVVEAADVLMFPPAKVAPAWRQMLAQTAQARLDALRSVVKADEAARMKAAHAADTLKMAGMLFNGMRDSGAYTEWQRARKDDGGARLALLRVQMESVESFLKAIPEEDQGVMRGVLVRRMGGAWGIVPEVADPAGVWQVMRIELAPLTVGWAALATKGLTPEQRTAARAIARQYMERDGKAGWEALSLLAKGATGDALTAARDLWRDRAEGVVAEVQKRLRQEAGIAWLEKPDPSAVQMDGVDPEDARALMLEEGAAERWRKMTAQEEERAPWFERRMGLPQPLSAVEIQRWTSALAPSEAQGVVVAQVFADYLERWRSEVAPHVERARKGALNANEFDASSGSQALPKAVEALAIAKVERPAARAAGDAADATLVGELAATLEPSAGATLDWLMAARALEQASDASDNSLLNFWYLESAGGRPLDVHAALVELPPPSRQSAAKEIAGAAAEARERATALRDAFIGALDQTGIAFAEVRARAEDAEAAAARGDAARDAAYAALAAANRAAYEVAGSSFPRLADRVTEWRAFEDHAVALAEKAVPPEEARLFQMGTWIGRFRWVTVWCQAAGEVNRWATEGAARTLLSPEERAALVRARDSTLDAVEELVAPRLPRSNLKGKDGAATLRARMESTTAALAMVRFDLANRVSAVVWMLKKRIPPETISELGRRSPSLGRMVDND